MSKVFNENYKTAFELICEEYNTKDINELNILELLDHLDDDDINNIIQLGSTFGTLLDFAIRYNQVNIVKKLLTFGNINVNDSIKYDTCPLTTLIEKNKKEEIFFSLFEHPNIDLNYLDHNYLRPIDFVIMNQDLKKFKLFLDNANFDINAHNERSNPILFQVLGERMRFLIEILKHPALDINVLNINGDTALMHTIKYRGIKYVKKLLISSDIDVNIKNRSGLTALMIAVRRKKYKIVKLLLKHPNIDINIKDNNNLTAFNHTENEKILQLFYSRDILNKN